MADMVLDKLLYAYNPGPTTLAYPSPARDSVDEIVLRPYKHTPVPRAYLNQPAFRRDMLAKKFNLVEAEVPPVDPNLAIGEQFTLDPQLKAFVQRLCNEPFTPQFQGAVALSRQIAANGRPVADSNITVAYLREVHSVVCQAALDLEKRWRKRKAVITALTAELKAIEKLGKYV